MQHPAKTDIDGRSQASMGNSVLYLTPLSGYALFKYDLKNNEWQHRKLNGTYTGKFKLTPYFLGELLLVSEYSKVRPISRRNSFVERFLLPIKACYEISTGGGRIPSGKTASGIVDTPWVILPRFPSPKFRLSFRPKISNPTDRKIPVRILRHF